MGQEADMGTTDASSTHELQNGKQTICGQPETEVTGKSEKKKEKKKEED